MRRVRNAHDVTALGAMYTQSAARGREASSGVSLWYLLWVYTLFVDVAHNIIAFVFL